MFRSAYAMSVCADITWRARIANKPLVRRFLQLLYLVVVGGLLGAAIHLFFYGIVSSDVFSYTFLVCPFLWGDALLCQVASIAFVCGLKFLCCRRRAVSLDDIALERAMLPLILLAPAVCLPVNIWTLLVFVMIVTVAFGRIMAAFPLRSVHGARSGVPGQLWIIVLGIVLFVCYYSYLQHKAFHSLLFNYSDWAIYFNALDNTFSGKWFYANDICRNYLGHHFMPGSFLLMAPVWLAARCQDGIFVFNALVLAAGALPLYLLARARRLSPSHALLLALAFLLHPSLSDMSISMFYGFHPVYLSIPLIICFFWLYETGRFWLAGLVFCLSLTINESVPVFWFFAGAFMFFTHSRRLGCVVVATSVLYLVLVLGIVIPGIKGGGNYDFLMRYSSLGRSYGAVAFAPFTETSKFLELLCRPKSWCLFLILVFPFLGEGLAVPLCAGAIFPFLALVFLQDSDQLVYLGVQYQSEALAAIAVAAAYGLAKISAGEHVFPVSAMAWGMPELLRPGQAVRTFAAMTLCCALLCHLFLGLGPISKNDEVRRIEMSPVMDKVITSMKALVPERCALLATPSLAAHFFLRDDVYVHFGDVDAAYVVADLNDRYARYNGFIAELAKRRPQFDMDYELLYSSSGDGNHKFRVFRKRSLPAGKRQL